MGNTKRTAIVEKIKKLLRLAKSSNEHEAALAAAHAQRLLAEHNLNEADLTESEIPKEAGIAAADTVKKPADWLFLLASSVAGAFDCKYFHSSCGKTFFVGVGIDHEIASFTFGYLYRAINRMVTQFMKKRQQRRLTLKGQRKARRSYCLGAADVVCLTLQQQKAVTPVTCRALVPVKEALIAAKLEGLGVESKALELDDVSSRSYWTGRRDGAGIDPGRRAMPDKKARPLRIGR